MNNTKINNNGGPAFPFTFQELDGQGNPRSEMIVHSGMSLRDLFAGFAMQGWLASYPADYPHPASDDQHQSVAKLSYIVADAMLAERNRKEEV